MSSRAWPEIVAAYEDVSRLVGCAFADRAKRPDLDVLRARLRRRLDALMTALAPPLPPEEATEILVPLVLLLDEKVQRKLAGAAIEDLPEWAPLQRDLFPDGDGGDAFYERAAALLRVPETSPLVLGAYLFCLQAGFQGRLVDEPASIPEWKAKLAARLPAPPPAAAPPASASLQKARSRLTYALWATLALFALQIVLLAIARVM